MEGTDIEPQNTLIIFDEIQEAPKALTSLKYFQEDAPEYAVVSAGSLLRVLCEKYDHQCAVRFSMSDYREQDWMVNVPLYELEWLRPLF